MTVDLALASALASTMLSSNTSLLNSLFYHLRHLPLALSIDIKRSGVTILAPQTPQCGGPRAYGGPKLWHYFFHWKFNTAIFVRTFAAMSKLVSNGWIGCSVDLLLG